MTALNSISDEHLATLREMSDAYQRGQVPHWSRNRANALEQAVNALLSARVLWASYRQLNDLIDQERRVYAEQLGEARRQGWNDALQASLPENTPQEVADDQP